LDEEQGEVPKSTEAETLVPLASKHTDSVPAAPIAPADGTLVQREHKRSSKKASSRKEAASSLPQ
jgi:hypothetical protein